MAATTSQQTASLLSQTHDTLTQLRDRHSQTPLNIVRLSEPLTTALTHPPPFDPSQSHTSTSSSSALSSDAITPTTLTSDLTHYRDLFTKLHFSYIEQVTKEKYLRAIVGDPPLLHTHQENVELETQTLEMKRALKERKVGVETMVEEMRGESDAVARGWEEVQSGMERVQELEGQVGEREQRVAALRREVEETEAKVMEMDGDDAEPAGSEAQSRLGLEDTLALIKQKEQGMREMEKRIQALQREMPARVRECEMAERDLEALEMRKNVATADAVEARRRKERGDEGGRDEVEERGRWYRSQEVVFRGLGLVEA